MLGNMCAEEVYNVWDDVSLAVPFFLGGLVVKAYLKFTAHRQTALNGKTSSWADDDDE